MCTANPERKSALPCAQPPVSKKIEGSDILVAAGRIPNTAGIGLEKAGVELDGRGYIRVNERLETTARQDNLAGGKRSTVRYNKLDKMIQITAFQPKWVSMYARSQFPPTEIFTKRRPSVVYFSCSDGLRL